MYICWSMQWAASGKPTSPTCGSSFATEIKDAMDPLLLPAVLLAFTGSAFLQLRFPVEKYLRVMRMLGALSAAAVCVILASRSLLLPLSNTLLPPLPIPRFSIPPMPAPNLGLSPNNLRADTIAIGFLPGFGEQCAPIRVFTCGPF
jgi:hypothetical protein